MLTAVRQPTGRPSVGWPGGVAPGQLFQWAVSGSTLPASGPAPVLIEADVEDLNAGNSAVGLDPGGLQDPVVPRAGEVSDD